MLQCFTFKKLLYHANTICCILYFGACSSLNMSAFEDKDKWILDEYIVAPGWTQTEALVPVALTSLPESYPKSHHLVPQIVAGNQGAQASGSAWAVGYLALSHHYQIKKNEVDYHCSPAFIYNQSVKGKNVGMEAIQALYFIEDSGCPNDKYMPYEEMNLLQRPNMQAIEDASKHVIKGFARVDFTDLNQVKAHLLQNSVVIVTMLISENFVTLDDFEWKYPSGKKVGVQTLGIVGYDDSKNVFILQNSSGPNWGEQGRATVSYNWFLRLTKKAFIIW